MEECIYACFFTVMTILLSWLYWKSTANFDYWKKKGVAYIQPIPFFGNIQNKVLLKSTTAEIVKDLYDKLKGHKIGGYFEGNVPVLMFRDPEIIKYVMTRDFNHFHDRNPPYTEKGFSLGENLVFLTGNRWKRLRAKLTPAFTSGKIKMMLPIMKKCAEELLVHLDTCFNDGGVVDMKEVAARFSIDVIGCCAFGLNMDSLKDPTSKFRKIGKKVFEPNKLSGIVHLLVHFFPRLMTFLKPPYASVEVTDFFSSLVSYMIEFRKTHEIVRNDFIQLLIDLKNKGKLEYDDVLSKEDLYLTQNEVHGVSEEKKFESFEVTDNLLAAQCFIFFLAGFETTSHTISCCIYELACHPEIQEKAFGEIDTVLRRYNGEINYEAIQDLKYLDQIIKETLRLSPAVGNLPRVCTKAYTIPRTSVKIDEGSWTIIPVYALHHDPEYYPDPEQFHPERFNSDNEKNIPQFSYLPFGEGPRICIGMRFGLIETKLAISTLLLKYEFSVCDKTIIPLRNVPNSKVTTCTCDLWLKVTPRKISK